MKQKKEKKKEKKEKKKERSKNKTKQSSYKTVSLLRQHIKKSCLVWLYVSSFRHLRL